MAETTKKCFFLPYCFICLHILPARKHSNKKLGGKETKQYQKKAAKWKGKKAKMAETTKRCFFSSSYCYFFLHILPAQKHSNKNLSGKETKQNQKKQQSEGKKVKRQKKQKWQRKKWFFLLAMLVFFALLPFLNCLPSPSPFFFCVFFAFSCLSTWFALLPSVCLFYLPPCFFCFLIFYNLALLTFFCVFASFAFFELFAFFASSPFFAHLLPFYMLWSFTFTLPSWFFGF